jgi:hypothetical protein
MCKLVYQFDLSPVPRPSPLAVPTASERVVLKIEHIGIPACSSLRELLPYNRLAGGTPISEYPPRPKSPSDAQNGSEWRMASGEWNYWLFATGYSLLALFATGYSLNRCQNIV